jgi:hypothetical protein
MRRLDAEEIAEVLRVSRKDNLRPKSMSVFLNECDRKREDSRYRPLGS